MRRPPPSPFPDPDGLLLVDKPSGMTSHDVVDDVRRRFRFRKVGHGGTLDPMATGLLILLIGRGTKASERVMSADKTYEGAMRFGIETDTEDADGRITAERDPSGVATDAILAAMAVRQGDQMQTPPMVSAVKKEGVPLYKLARKGKTVDREPRLIHVYEFSLLGFEPPRAQFRLRCTKGTYVRTLCADIGRDLGCGAMLESLRRTQSGAFNVRDARPLDAVLGLSREDLSRAMVPLTSLLPVV